MAKLAFLTLVAGPLQDWVQPATAQTLTVYAAVSLKNALDEINQHWVEHSKQRARVVYAASSALARQIEQGAPAHVFISADQQWMDYLQIRGLIRPNSRTIIARNRLALIAQKDSDIKLSIASPFPLARALDGGRLALGNPAHVPAGRYARAALVHLGAWDSVQARLAPAENVRSALSFVARGEAALGIVYRSDVVAEDRVRILGLFPADTHPAIEYPAALVSTTKEPPDARAMVDFMRSAEGQAVLSRHGFDRAN